MCVCTLSYHTHIQSLSLNPFHCRNVVTALWYIAQALGVLLNAAVLQIPISLVYQFFLYFLLMLLVTAIFLAVNSRTCCLKTNSSNTQHNNRTHKPDTKCSVHM